MQEGAVTLVQVDQQIPATGSFLSSVVGWKEVLVPGKKYPETGGNYGGL